MSESLVDAAAHGPPGGADAMARISHYALLSGLCQFIPIPFADDAAELRVRRQMVKSLLRRRGRSFEVSHVEPLYRGPPRSLAGRAGSLAKGLLLKPLKKLLRTVFFVALIRRAILEAAEVLLLGHTLDRLLAEGWFAEDAPIDRRREEAARVERAVGAAMASPERPGLVRLIRASAGLLRGRKESEIDAPDVTAALPSADEEGVEQSLSADQRRRLSRATTDLSQRLEKEEGRSLLVQLDAIIDNHLRRA